MHTARVLWTCKGAEDMLLISAGLRHVAHSAGHSQALSH